MLFFFYFSLLTTFQVMMIQPPAIKERGREKLLNKHLKRVSRYVIHLSFMSYEETHGIQIESKWFVKKCKTSFLTLNEREKEKRRKRQGRQGREGREGTGLREDADDYDFGEDDNFGRR